MIRIKFSASFAVIAIMSLYLIGCSHKPTIFESVVIDIKDGDYLVLEDGKIVDPVGFFIPKGEQNYKSFMDDYLKKLTAGKKVTFTIITKAKIDYPKYDLVEVTIDGMTLNEKMLEEGMAFFDHGYYAGKEKYEKLEVFARKSKKGIWSEGYNVKPLLIGSRKWNHVHYADCPEVLKIKPADKIFYYFYPLDIYRYRTLDLTCHFCAKKYRDLGGRY